MRKVLLASLIAAGIGFVAAPAGQAAPVNNTVLKQLTDMDNVTQVGWHSRYRSHWRWGSRAAAPLPLALEQLLAAGADPVTVTL